MSPISRGFRGRSRVPAGEEDRVPPGQHVTTDFPVLSAGPTPQTPFVGQFGAVLFYPARDVASSAG